MSFFPDLTNLGFSQLLFFALAVIGCTHLIVDSAIFAPIREFLAVERDHKTNVRYRIGSILVALFSLIGWTVFYCWLGKIDWNWFVLPFFMGASLAIFWPINKIVECYQCCGTWVGFFGTFFLIGQHPIVVLLGGGAGSFLAYSAAVGLTYFESQSVVQPAAKDNNGNH